MRLGELGGHSKLLGELANRAVVCGQVRTTVSGQGTQLYAQQHQQGERTQGLARMWFRHGAHNIICALYE